MARHRHRLSSHRSSWSILIQSYEWAIGAPDAVVEVAHEHNGDVARAASRIALHVLGYGGGCYLILVDADDIGDKQLGVKAILLHGVIVAHALRRVQVNSTIVL